MSEIKQFSYQVYKKFGGVGLTKLRNYQPGHTYSNGKTIHITGCKCDEFKLSNEYINTRGRVLIALKYGVPTIYESEGYIFPYEVMSILARPSDSGVIGSIMVPDLDEKRLYTLFRQQIKMDIKKENPNMSDSTIDSILDKSLENITDKVKEQQVGDKVEHKVLKIKYIILSNDHQRIRPYSGNSESLYDTIKDLNFAFKSNKIVENKETNSHLEENINEELHDDITEEQKSHNAFIDDKRFGPGGEFSGFSNNINTSGGGKRKTKSKRKTTFRKSSGKSKRKAKRSTKNNY